MIGIQTHWFNMLNGLLHTSHMTTTHVNLSFLFYLPHYQHIYHKLLRADTYLYCYLRL